MTDVDPPATLTEALERFKAFLAKNGFPETIRWIGSSDLVATAPNEYAARKLKDDGSQFASTTYAAGVTKGEGVELRAIVVTETETFATVFVPKDDDDAQNHLMRRGLKLTCPVERAAVRTVRNPIRCVFLFRRDGGGSRVLFE